MEPPVTSSIQVAVCRGRGVRAGDGLGCVCLGLFDGV